jgi:hypothetical protein
VKRLVRALGLIAACAVLWFSPPASAQISANGQMDTAGVRPIARGNYTTFTASSGSCPTMGRSAPQTGVGFVAAFSQGMGNATIDVEGVADTLSVVTSMDGAHWVAVSKVYAMPYTGTSTSSITTTGQYTINAAGWMYVCVFDPSFVNGPPVTLNTSPASFADVAGGGGGGGGGTVTALKSPWTVLYDTGSVVSVQTTSPNLPVLGYTEILVWQESAAGPAFSCVINAISPVTGGVRLLYSGPSPSGGSNGHIIMAMGPNANIGIDTAMTGTTPWTYTIPEVLQFISSTSGRYVIYAR